MKYPYLEKPGIQLPDNVPDDLLLPFDKYLHKHWISSGFGAMINYLQGFGDYERLTTFYALKNLRPVDLHATLFNNDVHNPEGVVVLPAVYSIIPTTYKGLYNIMVGGDDQFSEQQVKRLIVSSIDSLKSQERPDVKVEDIVLLKDHSPYALYVEHEDIKAGFYKKLNDQQGYRNTYYVGAALSTHTSLAVWQHAQSVVEQYFPDKNL